MTAIEELRDRTHLVLGCPGAGKTYHLTTQVLPQLARSYGAGGLYCVSLTRAAAKEIGSRAQLDDEQCRTLHSYAWAYIKPKNVLESRDGIEMWRRLSEGKEAFEPFKLTQNMLRGPDDDVVEPTRGEETLAQVVWLMSDMTPVDEWNDQQRRFLGCLEIARKADLWDFTSLVWDMHRRKLPLMPGDTDAVVVDEAQDMSPLDLAAIWEGANTAGVKKIYLAGDPDQAIYEFRGASREAFLVDVPDEQVTRLTHSRRCPSVIAECAQSILDQSGGIAKRVLTWEGVGEGGALVARDRRAPLYTDIENGLKEGKDVMLLTFTNRNARAFRKQLDGVGIPHRKFNTEHESIDSKPVRAFARLLDMGEHKPVTTHHVWQFVKMMNPKQLPWKYKDQLAEVKRELDKALREQTEAEYIEANGLTSLGLNDLSGLNEGYHEQTFGDKTPLERDIYYLPDALKGVMRAVAHAVDDDDHAEVLRIMYCSWPRKFHGQIGAAAAALKARGVSSLLYGKACVVDTIHQVKGGEADIVYIDTDLPKATVLAGLVEDRPGEAKVGILRAFYVATTRAKERVEFLPPTRNPYFSPTG